LPGNNVLFVGRKTCYSDKIYRGRGGKPKTDAYILGPFPRTTTIAVCSNFVHIEIFINAGDPLKYLDPDGNTDSFPDGTPEQDIIWMRREGYTDLEIADHFLANRLNSNLTVEEIGNIIFNETRSLNGDDIQEARENIAHAIINGSSTLGEKRPITGSTVVSDAVRNQDNQQYQDSQQAALQAVFAHVTTGDPTNGSVHFNFRTNNSRANFYDAVIQTQVGPLNNSYPNPGLPASTGIYGNTYRRQ
jgi:hypothetical protein